MNSLADISLSKIKGVGPKKEQLLNEINIYSIKDLLTHYPRDYQNLRDIRKLSFESDEKILYKLKLISQPLVKRVRANMNILSFFASDGLDRVEVIYFNQAYLQKSFSLGKTYYFLGQAQRSSYGLQLKSPELIDPSSIGIYKPIYGLTKGLNNNEVTKFIIQAFNTYKAEIIDYLPDYYKKKYGLMDLRLAIRSIHYPSSRKHINEARKRLAFDEIFLMQAYFTVLSKGLKVDRAPRVDYENNLQEVKKFEKNLSFDLTGAQKKVVNEILSDMASGATMNRLLQGDVGSGKTIVAAFAILVSYLNSYQSAFMAPTELLARQQYESFKEIFSSYIINIDLLTSSVKMKEKERIYSGLKKGKIDLIVGTHALIQDKVEFSNLALTIIDEQHRFGVKQRQELASKGTHCHNLLMTATPIPRSLALALYGDIEISEIDELPANRKKIETIVIDDSYMERMDKFVLDQIRQGRQVYVVCPLIEDGDGTTSELKSLEDRFEHYTSSKFANVSTAYIHGKMDNDEKNSIMENFINNKINILVSTTVIEVGINVPNASLMIIYDADRFGLSQLHQLRGRVGRGSEKSYCVLVNNSKSSNAYERMQIIKKSNDGFYIAKKDLDLRGEGELLGFRQHGLANFKIAQSNRDEPLFKEIKNEKDEIIAMIEKDKNLKKEFSSLLARARDRGD